MPNKRVLSASPDADTALDLQHMKTMPRKDILRGKLRDPVHNLNGDILNLIFDRLPIVDIVSCVFLSKAWKSAVLIWMHQSSKLAGQKLRRLCYETAPATLWQGMSIAEIKHHASSLYRMNSAKATSLFSCHGPVGYLDVGDFVAHLSRGDPNFSDLDSVLRWRPLEPAYNPQDNELKVYEIPRMSERFLDSTVVAVFVNRDGVVLVNLEHLRVQERRLFVYSPVEEKRLWDYSYPIQDLRSRSLSWRVSFGPVALGRSYVYCVSAERPSSWVLLAYDFRTGKEVYRVRRGARCFHSQSTWLAEGKSVPDRLVRLVEVNGEELLVLISDSSKWAVGTVEIVKGRDGQLLHSIKYSPAWKASCLADPLTNQVALMWYKPAQKAVNLGHSITLMHTFSYQPGQPFALSPLIAVKRHTPCAQYETLQPFTMTNIEVTPTVMGGTPVQFTITRSCLVRVYSRWVYDLALQAALDLFDDNPNHIPCYTTDDPTAVTVSEPAGPSLPPSSQDSKTLSVNTMPIPAVYWLDHARLVIQAKAFTRVVRF